MLAIAGAADAPFRLRDAMLAHVEETVATMPERERHLANTLSVLAHSLACGDLALAKRCRPQGDA